MFDTVYQIALNATSFEDLKVGLEGHFIDQRQPILPFLSLAGLLAREGQDTKVEWLQSLGADIDLLTLGYALAKNHEKVEYYRTQHNAAITAIAVGYALAGDEERVEYYRAQHNAAIDVIAQAYAFAGNHKQVDHYQTTHKADISLIAMGYAMARNYQKVEQYWAQHSANASKIAMGYAMAGDDQLVKKYIELYRRKILQTARNIASEERPAWQANYYYASYQKAIDEITEVYICREDYRQVEIYRTQYGADINQIIKLYEDTRNHEQLRAYSIDSLLDGYLHKRTNRHDAAGKTKEYFYGSFFSAFQKSFTQKSDAVRALQAALKGEAIDLRKHLPTLRNGNLGKELRAFIKSGKANRLVDKEVNTVSAFVEAIQAVNDAKEERGSAEILRHA